MIKLKAPSRTLWTEKSKFSIFLAGSIDMGNARDWQTEVSKALSNYDVLLLNPRRDDWDSSWEQSVKNEQFVKQVTWEQYALRTADYRLFVMTEESKAPITLLELGRYSQLPGAVCCEEGFYRLANVEISAKLWGMPFYNNIDDLITHLKIMLDEKGLRSRG